LKTSKTALQNIYKVILHTKEEESHKHENSGNNSMRQIEEHMRIRKEPNIFNPTKQQNPNKIVMKEESF
jgi:hypothetical protein